MSAVATSARPDEATVPGTAIDIIADELLTPLTAVIGFSDLIASRSDRLSGDDLADFAAKANASATQLARRVHGLLAVLRSQAGRDAPCRRVLDVGTAITRVAEGANVCLRVEEVDLAAFVDPMHLEVIVEQLIANAHAHGRPPVVVTAARRGEWVTVTVEDDGPGLPPGQVDEMFEWFTQASAGPTRSRGGLGCGLPLSADLARRNRGTLEYGGGTGARFVLALPDARVVAPTRNARS